MSITPQISYRDVDHSDALDSLIVDETQKLERFFPRIISCRVLIEHRRHRTGAPYQARIVLSIPGEDIVINQGPDVHEHAVSNEDDRPPKVRKSTENVDAAFKDPVLAIRSAFKKARRRLQDRAHLRTGPSFRY